MGSDTGEFLGSERYELIRESGYVASKSPVSKSSYLKQANKISVKLKRESLCYAQVNSCLITAAIAYQKGDTISAIEHLKSTAELAQKNEITFHQHAAMYKLGPIMSGGEGQ